MGKLRTDELKELLSCIKKDARVIVPPQVGYDSGAHLIGDKYVVVAADPCIGVTKEWFGYLLIHYSASDVALFGAKPEFATVTLMGPPTTSPQELKTIMKQTCSAAAELDVAIVGGHVGTYDGLSELVGTCTAYGTVEPEKLITPKTIKSGDLILCTKPLGLETVVNFSLKHKVVAQQLFGKEQAKKLARLVPMQSCVKEALQLADVPGVHSMHDVTEGGLVAAMNELAEVTHLGFRVEASKIPITTEARILQNHFGFSYKQGLAMSSTGTILAAVEPEAKENVEKMLHKNRLEANFIGEFTETKNRIFIRDKKESFFPENVEDPYSQIMSREG